MLYCLWCTTYVHVGLLLSVYHLIPISPHSVSDLYKILCMCTSMMIFFWVLTRLHWRPHRDSCGQCWTRRRAKPELYSTWVVVQEPQSPQMAEGIESNGHWGATITPQDEGTGRFGSGRLQDQQRHQHHGSSRLELSRSPSVLSRTRWMPYLRDKFQSTQKDPPSPCSRGIAFASTTAGVEETQQLIEGQLISMNREPGLVQVILQERKRVALDLRLLVIYSSKTSLPPHRLLQGRDCQSLVFVNHLCTGSHTTLKQYYYYQLTINSVCLTLKKLSDYYPAWFHSGVRHMLNRVHSLRKLCKQRPNSSIYQQRLSVPVVYQQRLSGQAQLPEITEALFKISSFTQSLVLIRKPRP